MSTVPHRSLTEVLADLDARIAAAPWWYRWHLRRRMRAIRWTLAEHRDRAVTPVLLDSWKRRP